MKIGVLQSYPSKCIRILEGDYWSISSESQILTISKSDEGPIASFTSWDVIYSGQSVADIKSFLAVKPLPEEAK